MKGKLKYKQVAKIKMQIHIHRRLLVLVALLFCLMSVVSGNDSLLTKTQKQKVEDLMREGNIPGLSLVMISNNVIETAGFGFSDIAGRKRVDPETLFEIASCSKAFTALAMLRLESEGLLHLHDKVSKYLPWFYVTYKGKKTDITIDQLLHHTSGIPFKTISGIVPDSTGKAIENTVRKLVGTELSHMPGTMFEYATINYDIVGLIVQVVSKMSFEQYMRKNIFPVLGLKNTSTGYINEKQLLASGYKIGFLRPEFYDQPVFGGNYPAGYIISNGKDMAKWLSVQMKLNKTPFDTLIARSHISDKSVPPINNASYGYGWYVNEYIQKKIYNDGLNPNFSSYIAFYPDLKTGIVILANSNSPNTNLIGEYVLDIISGRKPGNIVTKNDSVDVSCSILCVLFSIYILLVLFLTVYKATRLRSFKKGLDEKLFVKFRRAFIVTLLVLLYVHGIYLMPHVCIGFSWDTVFVWTPDSFKWAIYLLLTSIGLSYLYYFLSLFFPGKNKYKNSIPVILLMSTLSGLANTGVLFIITRAFYSPVPLGYLIYYFILAYGLHIIGLRMSQARLIKLTNETTFDLKTFMINRLIRTRFENFEKLSDGKVLTTLNGDTSTIANSASVFVGLTTSIITVFSAFLYMSTISFRSTLIVFVVVLILIRYYYIVSKRARAFMEKSRSITNRYLSLLNDMIQGFKELSLHHLKKTDFRKDFIDMNEKYNKTNIQVAIRFLNSSLIGNSFIMIILGSLSIVMPRFSTQTDTTTLISFVMVLLYIIGPVNTIVGAIQQITSIRVAWNRITKLIHELQVNTKNKLNFWDMISSPENQEELKENRSYKNVSHVENIDLEGVKFEYKKNNPDEEVSEEKFVFGPVNLHLKAGEVSFIVGDNGSGKSTLINLLMGLYVPDEGEIKINGTITDSKQLGEYFAAIFSGDHLFRKMYGIDLKEKSGRIRELLEKMKLSRNVRVRGNTFSSIKLSNGQRKRLVLLKCFLEDRHIYVFDEFAADQDPGFRRFFYKEILPELKREGKIIILISHDEHYFDMADNLIRLDNGKIKFESSRKVKTIQ
jgi:cyclic peptide transporter